MCSPRMSARTVGWQGSGSLGCLRRSVRGLVRVRGCIDLSHDGCNSSPQPTLHLETLTTSDIHHTRTFVIASHCEQGFSLNLHDVFAIIPIFKGLMLCFGVARVTLVRILVGLPMQLETSSIKVSQYRLTLSKYKIDFYFPGMHIEWVKSRAHVQRWCEEVLLLHEEMRQILQYFHWKANCWLTCQSLHSDVTPEVSHGLNAYAAKQANLLQQPAKSFALLWYSELVKNNMPIEWPSIYIPVTVTSSDAMD